MYCLHCGDCCKRMSPLTGNGEPCPHIVEKDEFVFCGIYEKRPDLCITHDFPSRFCPVGIDVLQLTEAEDVRRRIDTGYELQKPKDL